jgi:tetratricopeptide (TPR) repeat protein
MKGGFAIAVGLVLASCLLLPTPGARAQSLVTAVGRVVDGQGNPLQDVQVLLDYKGTVVQKYRTKTDKTGKFIHLKVYEGLYRVTLSKDGLGTASFDFFVQDIPSTQPPPDLKFVVKVAAPPPPPGSGLAPAGSAAGGPAVDLGKLTADLNAATTLAGEGRIDEAVAAFEAIAAAAPQVPLVHFKLAAAYKKKGDTAKAEASFRKSIELDPGFVDGYVSLATLLAESGKKDQAVEVVRQGVAANEKSGRLPYALGVLEVSAGHNAAAREAFLKAESLDPQTVDTQFQLATVALNMNDRAEAVARLEKYIAAAPPTAPDLAVAKSLLAALQKK